jgi:cytochrome P450
MLRTGVEERTGIGLAEARTGQPEDVTAFDFPTASGITQCPYPFYEALRRQAPVFKHPERNEYLVARRKDILHVLQHPEIFSNDLAVGDERYRMEVASFLADDDEETMDEPIRSANSLVMSDPPDHTAKRRALAKVVSRDRLPTYEPVIEKIAHELVDGFVADGEVEFRARFADQLAVRTICAAAGFPDEAQQLVMQWARMGSRHGRRYMTAEQIALEDRSAGEQAAFVKGLI